MKGEAVLYDHNLFMYLFDASEGRKHVPISHTIGLTMGSPVMGMLRGDNSMANFAAQERAKWA